MDDPGEIRPAHFKILVFQQEGLQKVWKDQLVLVLGTNFPEYASIRSRNSMVSKRIAKRSSSMTVDSSKAV